MTPPPLDDEWQMEVEDSTSSLDNVQKIVEKPMCKGESWYLVDKKWYDQFEIYLSDRVPAHNPGPIDNSNLFSAVDELKDQLDEETDYKFVPEEAWKILYNYFGIKNDSHTIKRWVIEEGISVTNCVVEVYLVDLKICLYKNPSNSINISVSRTTTLLDLEEEMKRMFNIDVTRETRLHHLNTELVTFDGKTLADASISSGHTVVLEVRNKNGSWPSSPSRSTSTRSSTAGYKSHCPGVCGLQNLGNTCFMNSALQCLSNTPPLTEFIMSDKYLSEINRNNPLGMSGKIAVAYSELIKHMWSGETNCFTPRDFKYVVGSFAPQFSGYAQHDCQELMAFLLDGLHEDFNRIREKPYIELKTDVDRRPDHIVAQESWDNYKKRNDSIIVDTFHGLLKSTLVCPDCELISVTFDPFCYLSLPLPTKREKQIEVMFVPATSKSEDSNGNSDEAMEMAVLITGLSVPKYGSISDISRAVADAIDRESTFGHKINRKQLIVTEVHNHRIYKVYGNDDAIVAHMKDLVVYEMPTCRLSIPVHLREINPDGTKTLFGRPFFIGVDDEPNYDSIHDAAASHLNNFYQTPVDDDSNDYETSSSECRNGTESFSLTLTNTMGTIDLELLDRHKPIQLNGNSCLALDLTAEAKSKYYDPQREVPMKISSYKTPSSQYRSSIPLYECINNFTTTEKLGVEDSWYCPTCKTHQQATKKFDLWELPNVLIVHLKRFSYSRHWRDKLDTLVDFPVTGLDMSAHVIHNPDKKPILYDLIAVS